MLLMFDEMRQSYREWHTFSSSPCPFFLQSGFEAYVEPHVIIWNLFRKAIVGIWITE